MSVRPITTFGPLSHVDQIIKDNLDLADIRGITNASKIVKETIKPLVMKILTTDNIVLKKGDTHLTNGNIIQMTILPSKDENPGLVWRSTGLL